MSPYIEKYSKRCKGKICLIYLAAKSIKSNETSRILECQSWNTLKRTSLSNSFILQKRKQNIKEWAGSRQSWDKSTATLVQCWSTQTSWELTALRGRKRDVASTLIIHLCPGFWHLCFSFLALILLPDLWWEDLSIGPENWDQRSSLPWNPSYIPFLVCFLQAVLCLSSGLAPHPLASHPDFPGWCRKCSQLPEAWHNPSLFLIWSIIPSKKEGIW